MKRPFHKDIIDIFKSNENTVLQHLLAVAEKCRRESIGNEVYPRGLIEFSNNCSSNCLYCGLRKNNHLLLRYNLNREEIVALARTAYELGLQSIALQSGEIASEARVDFLVDIIKRIKDLGSQDANQSIGITLSVGELSYQQYMKLWEAGAHRYLLRMESSDPILFRAIHPPSQSYHRRLECLDALKDIGFQVGTGVMIGLPGQNYEHLAMDLLFFQERDIDMLGMGPYIPHPDTPLARVKADTISDPYNTTIKMMAIARLLMPDINMVASTALQSMHADGLIMGLKAGANVVMPVLTPEKYRPNYALYANKAYKPLAQLQTEIQEAGYELALWKWGDSAHYHRRRGIA